MFVIFDLDGTLCDISHRLHFVTGPRKTRDYDAFFAACGDDKPKWPILHTFDALISGGHRIEIWSGRSDQVWEQTTRWLDENAGIGRYLSRMRPHGDYRSDVDLKRQWLVEERENGNTPDLVFDDRQRLVDMWRAEGITCCQVDAWEES